MQKIKVVRTDKELQCPHVDAELRERGFDLVLLPDGVSEDDLISATRDAHLILMCYTPITARVISEARKLKGIVKYGVGIDAIDIPAASERGVVVVNVPEYAEETVAEGAFALMISLAKKLIPLEREMQTSGWAWPEQKWLGSDLAGKVLGLVGVGRIGRSMARMAGAGFRMHVLGYDPHVDASELQSTGVHKENDLQTMLAQCDFVSIHCVLNDETHHLIGATELACMKTSAVLINVSRGALVDEDALLAALLDKRIGGAGIDVFSDEPLRRHGHRLSQLFDLENVIATPHVTFYTHDAMQRLESETLDRSYEILEGRPVLVKSHDPRLRAQVHGVLFRES